MKLVFSGVVSSHQSNSDYFFLTKFKNKNESDVSSTQINYEKKLEKMIKKLFVIELTQELSLNCAIFVVVVEWLM